MHLLHGFHSLLPDSRATTDPISRLLTHRSLILPLVLTVIKFGLLEASRHRDHTTSEGVLHGKHVSLLLLQHLYRFGTCLVHVSR